VTFLAAVVIGLAIHEAGHFFAARSLGYPAKIVLTRRGPGTQWGSDDVESSRRDRLLVTLAGPLASAAGGMVLLAAGYPLWPLVAYVGLVQLLPLPHADGLRAWRTLRGRW